ncbi:hypothetical protein GCM10020331_040430 [Ectobacillus funiculus]
MIELQYSGPDGFQKAAACSLAYFFGEEFTYKERSFMMGWIYVLIGGFIEVFWVMGLKHASSPLEWAGVSAAILLSFLVFLFRAFKTLPIGTVYAVFTGIGTSGIVIVEMIFFGEPVSIAKLLFIALLIGGVIGLKTADS